LQGVLQYAEEGTFDKDSVIVVIFPDHGSRYLSKIYNDQWMKDQGFTEKDSVEPVAETSKSIQ
jgi:cystathionine beta-synthase